MGSRKFGGSVLHVAPFDSPAKPWEFLIAHIFTNRIIDRPERRDLPFLVAENNDAFEVIRLPSSGRSHRGSFQKELLFVVLDHLLALCLRRVADRVYSATARPLPIGVSVCEILRLLRLVAVATEYRARQLGVPSSGCPPYPL